MSTVDDLKCVDFIREFRLDVVSFHCDESQAHKTISDGELVNGVTEKGVVILRDLVEEGLEGVVSGCFEHFFKLCSFLDLGFDDWAVVSAKSTSTERTVSGEYNRISLKIEPGDQVPSSRHSGGFGFRYFDEILRILSGYAGQERQDKYIAPHLPG